MAAAGCSADGVNDDRTAVVPIEVAVSTDRLTLTVTTSYPTKPFCAKQADGVDVEVRGDVAIVAAYAKSVIKKGDFCTLECGLIQQVVTLDEPLARDVRFESPSGADPGCGTPATP